MGKNLKYTFCNVSYHFQFFYTFQNILYNLSYYRQRQHQSSDQSAVILWVDFHNDFYNIICIFIIYLFFVIAQAVYYVLTMLFVYDINNNNNDNDRNNLTGAVMETGRRFDGATNVYE